MKRYIINREKEGGMKTALNDLPFGGLASHGDKNGRDTEWRAFLPFNWLA
jgi:hypothetical protein